MRDERFDVVSKALKMLDQAVKNLSLAASLANNAVRELCDEFYPCGDIFDSSFAVRLKEPFDCLFIALPERCDALSLNSPIISYRNPADRAVWYTLRDAWKTEIASALKTTAAGPPFEKAAVLLALNKPDLDIDNYGIKGLIDGLKSNGILKSDGAECLETILVMRTSLFRFPISIIVSPATLFSDTTFAFLNEIAVAVSRLSTCTISPSYQGIDLHHSE